MNHSACSPSRFVIIFMAFALNAPYLVRLSRSKPWNAIRYKLNIDVDPDTKSRSVSLLMSFPNSGTSYTMVNVQKMTNTSGGSNYDAEVAEGECCHTLADFAGAHNSVRKDFQIVDHNKAPAAPFILHPSRRVPHNVLTKTHCGVGDATSFEEFRVACLSIVYHSDQPGNATPIPYSNEVPVTKYVHLIRSPMDNLVSRKHMAVRRSVKRGYISDPERAEFLLNDTIDSFQDWCHQYDWRELPRILHRNNSHPLREWLEDLAATTGLLTIPCVADLYWYVNWHNWALQLTEDEPDVLLLYYEDYTTDFNETVGNLLSFLELPAVAAPVEFQPSKSYAYFDQSQLTAIREFIRLFATDKCWHLLRRYFE